MGLAKSALSISLSDFDDSKYLISLPEISLDDFQRPEFNLLHLSAKYQSDEEFNKSLLTSMYFGKIKKTKTSHN